LRGQKPDGVGRGNTVSFENQKESTMARIAGVNVPDTKTRIDRAVPTFTALAVHTAEQDLEKLRHRFIDAPDE
jgi:hypothetical protein